MTKLILLLVILMGVVIYGCSTDQGGTGGYEESSGHQGHHY